jgi:hypothetical protein
MVTPCRDALSGRRRARRTVCRPLFRLSRIIPVACVNFQVRDIQFDPYPVPLRVIAGIGLLLADHVLVSDCLAGFRCCLAGAGIVLHAKVKTAGFVGEIF